MKRFPFIHQHDSMECGVACLAMICRYLGNECSMTKLSELCSATREGMSMYGLCEAAKAIYLRPLCAKLTVEKLCETPVPCILHWNQNHYVVLYRVRKGRTFYIADPGKGLIKYSRKEFMAHWASTHGEDGDKGIAMFIETTPDFYKVRLYDEEGRGRRAVKFLMGYMDRHRAKLAVITAGLAFGCVIQFLMPFLTQAIVDTGIRNKDIGFIWLILLGQLMLTASGTVVGFIRRRLLLRISMQVNIAMVSDFFVKLLKLPMSFFDTKLMGDLLQRMSDHGRVNTFLTQTTLSLAFSLLTFMAFSVVLLTYNAVIFLIFMAGSALYGGWIVLFLRKRKVLDYELFEQQAINNNKTYELITTIQEIKLQDCENRRRKEWEKTQNDLFNVRMKTLKMQQTQEAGSIFINEMKNIVITVVAATAVINGQMTLGMMLAVQYIIGQLNSPVEQLLGFFYSLQDVNISLERINEIHEADNEDGMDVMEHSLPGSNNGINVCEMSFKYDPHALKYTLKNVDTLLPLHKVTAIVGPSGSGKTTLLKLMLGYYPIREGRLTIEGCSVDWLSKKWLRRKCGVVMQDGVIFSESIARNIAVDDNDIDQERLVKAARIACIHDFIESLPLGYDTKIGRDGTGLSQGQKQRILIARAVYKDPEYLFLDEATNSLDANNERMIVENLNSFFKGKTVVIIAHRLSTVRHADNIIVMEQGSIVEEGNHEELTELKGHYYNLVKNQLELGS